MNLYNYKVTVYDIRGDFLDFIVRASTPGRVAESIRQDGILNTADGIVMINYSNCVSIEIEGVEEDDEG